MEKDCTRKNPIDGIRGAYGNRDMTELAKFTPLRLSPATYLMNRRFVPVILLGMLFAMIGRSAAAPLVENETLKLPSGRIAKILSVSKIEYSKGVMALMVRYQTTLSLDEHKAISQEVDDVWKFAEKDVEHYGYNEAIISTNETPKGIFITASRMVNFIYEQGADGKWTRLNRADFMAAQ
jgi:hypothetical protein